MAQKPAQIYQIKVTLDHTRPPIWRRIQVPGNTTLHELHDILQSVMGWDDSHLHMFTIDGIFFGDPAQDPHGELNSKNEANYKLNEVIHREGQRFEYEYDFGDSWEHTLLVEKILPTQEGVRYPICLKGKRACPPDDVGGVWGYENFVEAMLDPSHEEHEDYMDWFGGEFDPEAFDLEGVNISLQSMGSRRSGKSLNAWSEEEDELIEECIDLNSPWPQTLPDDQRSVAEGLPLRRDMITLLTYLRDNKVTGTKSTGNLPLKAVNEICARFVNPPMLEETVGDRVYRVRSETEVWPLVFLHVLASVGGMVEGGPGRRWKLTPLGERILPAPAPLQVWLLLATWWAQTNWAIASPFGSQDDFMPAGFSRLALKHLMDLPSGEPAAYEPFANRLIEDSGLVWPIKDQDTARYILNSLIEYVVINPQIDFGILRADYQPHKILGPEYRELTTIRITPFGVGLLDALNNAMR